MLIKKLNTISFSLFLVCAFLSSAFGDNKVIVVPMSSSKPAVIGYDQGDQEIIIGAADTIVRSVTLELPAQGVVIVNASGTFDWGFATDKKSTVQCSITQGTVVDENYFISGGSDISNYYVDWIPFAGNRAFFLNKGTQTFNLVCQSYQNTGEQLYIRDTTLHAIYYYQSADPAAGTPEPAIESTSDTCTSEDGRECD